MKSISKSLLSFVSLAIGTLASPTPPAACPSSSSAEYDYIVVGSGAGGGPLASRLALNGFKVLVIDAGHDAVNVNTTIPLYNARAVEDPETVLDYTVNLYANGTQVQNWYPRAQGLGGSTIHNALINLLQVDYEFDGIANLTGDSSWGASNMRSYFVNRIENNLYLNESIGSQTGHGYGGWLSTDQSPTNLVTDPIYYDPQLIDIVTGVQSIAPPVPQDDLNTEGADGVVGGSRLIITSDVHHNRSSVRDHLASVTQQSPQALNLLLDTMVTKILTCTNAQGKPQAYGVNYAKGAALLPVAHQFAGKQTLQTTVVTARYEVIISAGAYQTPQLLMLSGIGDADQLNSFGIPVVADLPGVGQNLMDRIEISVNWKLKSDFVIYNGCKFGDDPATDPCLAAWQSDGHTNVYSAGVGVYTLATKSSSDLPYLDLFHIWSPALFKGYIHGFSTILAENPNYFSGLILKARTKARGWVNLTGSDPQDVLDINKNLYATEDSLNDLYAVREAIKDTRSAITSIPNITQHILAEEIPGPAVTTDQQIEDYIRQSAWGHHACCTAKIGADDDTMAVLDGDFNVRGVSNLRVVDISIFPEIPGMFVTTPIYMVSEKASDVILATAKANSWAPSS